MDYITCEEYLYCIEIWLMFALIAQTHLAVVIAMFI